VTFTVDVPVDFGTVLKRLRRARGWSQETLAERAAISAQAVTALETGLRKTPYPKTITLLADALGLDDAARAELHAAAAAAKAARNAAADEPAAGALPVPLTAVVGRAHEIAELHALLAGARLVTVLGPGGIGKTTLALKVGRERYGGRAVFCDFAALTDGALVASAVASALGAPLRDDRDPDASLAAVLGAASVLLVLDNCEHVVADVARLASRLLSACPNLTILATSRRVLRVAGETVYRVPALAGATAVDLFVQRAAAVTPSFALNDENAGAVARVCHRLDGMALAIELAAAQLRLMSLTELERRLAQQLRLLGDEAIDDGRRPRTLRATFDWSYALLGKRQQRFFRGLGIFAGSFTLEAALAVCCEEGAEELYALALLGALVDASLLVVDAAAGTTRFRYLETTRAYATELLQRDGEHEALATRHLAYLRARAGELDIAHELEDLRAAVHWAQNGGDVVAGADLLARFGTRWSRLGLAPEGVQRLEGFLPRISPDDVEMTARAWIALAFLRGQLLRFGIALDAARTAVDAARRTDAPAVLFNALRARATFATLQGAHDEGDAALREAADLVERHPSPVRSLLLFDTQGLALIRRGEFAGAVRAFRAGCAIARGLGDPYMMISTSNNLAEAEHEAGNTVAAIATSRALRADPALRGIENGLTLTNLAGYLVALGDDDAAIATARELAERRGALPSFRTYVTSALEHVALARAGKGDLARAARIAAYCAAWYAAVGYERQFTEQRSHERLTALLDERLPPAERAVLTAEGAHFSEERAVREAFGEDAV
jgi:predicted ATPase/DNA-binding XRE family transcriptional regulator